MKFDNSKIRRQDRTLDEAKAFELLKNGEYGILSMQSEDGNGAYGVPVNYVWDRGNSIYLHCAPVGRKLKCIDACENVSFCVVGRTKVIPDKFTTAYESVVLRCTAHHGLHEAERMSALSLLLSKYCPDHKMAGIQYAEKSFPRTEIIRLDIEEVSGKTKDCF
ncbi:pyridoxamine 5'-phosphate oxidase family protein [uncultured Bacteroides sp.]|uniref:pyridoxamine 5'-phosphate oxidase family protein n=1 Tax=uncultured Bacteroides sp. TaxID=162156 RepID=UPI0026320514|nr:pyridoxamine 5'-phosphate oxidase family protein [uncultured Bacteroides sp.]